jgi:hypothetical protein
VSVCVCVVDLLTIPFNEALVQWRRATKKLIGVLDDELHATIRNTLHNRKVTDNNYITWNRKYEVKVIEGVVTLYTQSNTMRRKAPSGRHGRNKKQDAGGPSTTIEEEVPVDMVDEAPVAVSSSQSAAAAAPAVSPVIQSPVGRAYPSDLSHFNVLKIVPYISDLPRILESYHVAGHCGVDRLYEQISLEYVGINRDMCTGFCRRCETCAARFKSSSAPPRVLHAIPTNRYGDHMQADCLSFLDKRGGGIPIVRVILNIVDMATKLHDLTLLENKCEATMKRAFWRAFIRMGGPPDILQTDNGTEFTNKLVNKLLQKCGILNRRGAPYQPSSQGVVERSNAVLRRMLEIICGDQQYRDWLFEDLLLLCQYWMNSNCHRTTKQSSYFTVFGRVPRLMEQESPIKPEEKEGINLGIGIKKMDEEEEEEQKEGEVVAAAAAVVREQRSGAAAVNHQLYQDQWTAQRNQGVTDTLFSAGQVVWLRVVSKRKHKAIARQMDNQKVLVLRALPYAKYEIYTIHGPLKESVSASELLHLTADTVIPKELALDADQRQQLMAEYQTVKGKRKMLTIDNFIDACLRIPLVVVNVSHTIAPPKDGDAEFRPVLTVKRRRLVV